MKWTQKGQINSPRNSRKSRKNCALKSKDTASITKFCYKDLATSEQVFVRHGAPTGSLQPTYCGPYPVLNMGSNLAATDGQSTSSRTGSNPPTFWSKKSQNQPKQQQTKPRNWTTKQSRTIRTRSKRISRPQVRFFGF